MARTSSIFARVEPEIEEQAGPTWYPHVQRNRPFAASDINGYIMVFPLWIEDLLFSTGWLR